MTAVEARSFVCIDEWCGILLLTYLWRVGEKKPFWIVLTIWTISVYLLGYVPLWLRFGF